MASSQEQEVVVTGQAAYPVNPQVDLGQLTPSEHCITVDSTMTAGAVVHFSFDGSTDHGRVQGGHILSTTRKDPRPKVWFRHSGGGGVAKVLHTAESDEKAS